MRHRPDIQQHQGIGKVLEHMILGATTNDLEGLEARCVYPGLLFQAQTPSWLETWVLVSLKELCDSPESYVVKYIRLLPGLG